VKRPAELRENVRLHSFISLRVGGPARLFAEPGNPAAAAALVRWASERAVEWTCLGGGTNLLLSDSGYDGLVVRTMALRGEAIVGTRARAAAGESLSALAWRVCERGLSGLEWACGIPGTVGGAVVMNAGTRDGETAEVLVEVESVGVGRATRRPASDLRLGYRTSALLSRDLQEVITAATFDLAPSTPERTLATARQILDERARRLPHGATAGCTFRNPCDGLPAGALLDRAGCKGLRVGDVRVSSLHANFLINEGSENAADVLELIEAMKRRVKEAFGVELVEEIVIL